MIGKPEHAAAGRLRHGRELGFGRDDVGGLLGIGIAGGGDRFELAVAQAMEAGFLDLDAARPQARRLFGERRPSRSCPRAA